MQIRTYRSGDEIAQAEIYNEAAANLPKFKPATAAEVGRRCQARDFDPSTRFYADDNGRVVGYAVYHPNGRVSYPWCRPGFESAAAPLHQEVIAAMRGRNLLRAYAAYRRDWPEQISFLCEHGFKRTREMVNFVVDLSDIPMEPRRLQVSPVRPDDLSALTKLARGLIRETEPGALENAWVRNPYFSAQSVFVVRRDDGQPAALAVVVQNPDYTDPRVVDADMPCFRLGAFGTEGMQVKRLNGLFSFVAADESGFAALARALLRAAADRVKQAEALAAQAPSDVPHLLGFYERYFRRQGSFPVLERAL
jgi:hypothetical protein